MNKYFANTSNTPIFTLSNEHKKNTKMPTYRIYRADGRIKFAGTDHPSFFTNLKKAVEKCDFDKGETVHEYCTKYQSRLWEVCVDKRYLLTH